MSPSSATPPPAYLVAVTLSAVASCLLGLVPAAGGIEWLGVAGLDRPAALVLTDAKLTRRYGLNQQRVAQLRANANSAQHVREASRMTMDACQDSFKDNRWNCSSIRRLPTVSNELALGTREQAYVYALASAMLTYWVAQACACGCAAKDNEVAALRAAKRDAAAIRAQWSGVGCNAKLDFAVKFSERFTDSQLKKSKKLLATSTAAAAAGPTYAPEASALVNLHNSAVGRQVARDSKTTLCRCQGVSGSCTVKACTHEVDKAKIVGTMKDKYGRAVQLRKRHTLSALAAELESVAGELTYHGLSPDYCLPDPTRGSQGTRDRICGDGDLKNNCDSLCCRRGFRTTFHVRNDKCNCRYLWCCSVECDVCSRNVTEQVCN